MSWAPRKRFWQAVSVQPAAEGFAVHLDARPLRTPAKAALIVPTPALAEAIAEEWATMGEVIDPERLPLTRAVNTAIDRVAREGAAVVETIAAYGETDLICYRADGPEGLIRRQAEAWDPWLDWSAEALGAPLRAVAGVIHVAQDPVSLGALRRAVAAHDALGLTALHDLVTLSGSLVLGLAVSRGALDAAQAWRLSRLDEAWQTEQWGADDDAEALAAVKAAAFLRAEGLLLLARGRE